VGKSGGSEPQREFPFLRLWRRWPRVLLGVNGYARSCVGRQLAAAPRRWATINEEGVLRPGCAVVVALLVGRSRPGTSPQGEPEPRYQLTESTTGSTVPLRSESLREGRKRDIGWVRSADRLPREAMASQVQWCDAGSIPLAFDLGSCLTSGGRRGAVHHGPANSRQNGDDGDPPTDSGSERHRRGARRRNRCLQRMSGWNPPSGGGSNRGLRPPGRRPP